MLFFAVERGSPFPRLPRALTLRLLVVAAAATIVSHLLVTPEMVSLKERAGAALDALPRTDPVLRDWGRLHAISALALLVRIGCAAWAVALDGQLRLDLPGLSAVHCRLSTVGGLPMPDRKQYP